MRPDYSIVLPAYNEEALLPGTLGAIQTAMAAVDTHRGEIVVTNNGSNDRTAEIARNAGAQVVFEGHRQIARSRNVGGLHATGRHLIFVDADTQISPALLRRTLEALDSGRVCGGGTVIAIEGTQPRWVRVVIRIVSQLMRRYKWACGAYLFCPRQAFIETGGFNERYYASEEIHFSQALKRWGRGRRMRFVILDEPIQTSLRKLEWYTPRELLRMVRQTLLAPARLRERATCELWYTRPRLKSSISEPGTLS